MKHLFHAILFLLSVSLIAAPAAQAAKVKPVLLKVPVAFSTKLPALGTPIVKVKEDLEAASDGRIRVKIYEPNKLVAPFEILGAVSSGKVNAGFGAAMYWSGEMPAAPFFSAIPFGPEAGEYLAWMYYGNGLTLYQRMYDEAGKNVHALPCALLSAETSGWFGKAIEDEGDLKGLNIRFAGLGGRVMERLGAAITLLPGGEIFPALEKGALDATEFSSPAIDEGLGFYKIAKYNYFPGWHQQATILELLINGDQWRRMTPGQQRLLEVTCKASVMDSFAHGEAIQGAVMERNRNEHGVHIRDWSDDMLALFQRAWREVVAEEAEKDAFFKEVRDDLSAFRARYDLWESHAFLPRSRAGGERK
uniref:TRAP-type mannitol/chloroaromatic compound transport system, substrate-binding protein n=1 Tax=Candidatus Kentrum eta TaxID=2126337 RepID=A0A450UTC8_9GAMM|nr:MAG: TRAP-type mannitol/chloroaromatic compound transport system, substrate-binding protein [Candidatus Kentron sp. H]VFJ89099.1 MAG: TRAP-type mannitol/chloroaromatic compound transport system, substrate-binding protein [Candidatus Kentron sp. H]VFJ95787.1 MAG: TRAP-type mannitol/chloroaromatic compound transport system, substrate-binding protein [Candidatus Kentron sp. H]